MIPATFETSGVNAMTDTHHEAVVLRGGTVFEGDGSDGAVRDLRIEGGTISEQREAPGDLVIDDEVYGPGDYQGTPAGGTHPLWTTRTGCVVLVRYEAE